MLAFKDFMLFGNKAISLTNFAGFNAMSD